ncbi:MAG: hypothetical protein L6R35_003455 [Caloplaca aegaea]|nr:MAG: hypothetical protein L6R35_003455 [Caloplaca aegaea]
MNVQRFTQLSARRSKFQKTSSTFVYQAKRTNLHYLVLQKPTSLTSIRYRAPAIITHCKPLTQSRPAATESIPPSYKVPLHDGNAILNRQRLNRPVSPHLTIYQPQIPWMLSGLNRITGSVLSGGFYVFGFAYLVAPLLGWHIESAALAESFAELPTLVKGGLKFLVALPFTFHSFNGVRHLIWDTGREFANKSVVRTGWVVVGLTMVSSLGLAVYGT